MWKLPRSKKTKSWIALPLASPIINWLEKEQAAVPAAFSNEHVPRYEGKPKSNTSQAVVAIAVSSESSDTDHEQSNNEHSGKEKQLSTTDATHKQHHHMNRADKCYVIRWMTAETGECQNSKRIQSKIFAKFPQFFKSGSFADYIRAKRLWSKCEVFVTEDKTGQDGANNLKSKLSLFCCGKKRTCTNARAGRGRKCAAWITHLEKADVMKFDRLRKLGVKVFISAVKAIANAFVAKLITD